MSDSYVQLQVPLGPTMPAYYSSKNSLWDNAREAFTAGALVWEQAAGFVARLFSPAFVPDFSAVTFFSQVPSGVWLTAPVALQGVAREDGYCKALGVRFPAMLGNVQIGGCAIYSPATGRMIWAASDFIGNTPQLAQDVYVVWPGNFKGPFRV